MIERNTTMRNLDSFYKSIEENLSKEAALAARDFMSIYDDGIYKWLAGLWDKEIGGFYYSVSARDNEFVEVKGEKILLLPDIESTSQAFGSLLTDGIVSKMSDYPTAMKDKAVKFITSCQDPEDGYFYHKQWGKNINTSRRARDMNKGMSTVRGFGGRSLYPTALERIKEAAETGSFDNNNSTVPEHLRSKEAFIKYLESLDINGKITKGRSYWAGHTIGQQIAEINAAGLTDVCYEFLNSTQCANGLWEEDVNYTSANGLMKISCAYNELKRPFPRVVEAFDAAMDVACLDQPIDGITSVYNPPFTMLNLYGTVNSFYDNSVREECQKRLVEKAPLILRRAMEKVAPFKEPDGSFSYCKGSPASYSQGMPVCIPGLPESDVNANALAQGARTMTFKALGISNTPLFDENDAKIFFEIAGESM